MAKAKSSNAVGVIGLGSMGLGVAHTLLGKGFTVYAYDVRPQVLRDFARKGGKACASPGEVGAKAPVVIVLVVNAEQTAEVLFGRNGAAARMARGSVLIASATVAPAIAEEMGARLKGMGIHMIDAPVSGGAARAATGQLSIMASGAREGFARAEAALGAIAAKVYRLGDAPGMGSKVKMINQLLAGVHIAASAEAMALGIRAGVDPNVLYEVICNSAGSSWMFQNRVPHILAGTTPRCPRSTSSSRTWASWWTLRARTSSRSRSPPPRTRCSSWPARTATAWRTTRQWSRCSGAVGHSPAARSARTAKRATTLASRARTRCP